MPTLKDPDRVPDPSTLRRWSRGLDRSQPAASFLRQTLARVVHWLARGDQADPNAWPLSVADSSSASPLAPASLRDFFFRPPSLPGNAGRLSPTLVSGGKTAPWARISNNSNSAFRCSIICGSRTGAADLPVTAREFVGLCPLHPETRPSFYVNARKNLFYCHGCGQGGDLIRFVELSLHLSFPSKPGLSPTAKRSGRRCRRAGASRCLLSAATPAPPGGAPVSRTARSARSRPDRRTAHRLCSRRKLAASSH